MDTICRGAYLLLGCGALCVAPLKCANALSQFVLYCLGVERGCATGADDKERLDGFLRSAGPAVVVYNHPTFFDFAVLTAEFGARFRFVAFAHRLLFPASWIAKRMGAVIIRPRSGASLEIVAQILRRRPGEPVVTLSPTAGRSHEDYATSPHKLAEFHSGAFLAKAPVLPIIIRYSSTEHWRVGQSFASALWNRLCGGPMLYRVHVLPPMAPMPEEGVAEFKERVRHAMETEPADSNVPRRHAYRGSWWLCATSSAFIGPAWVCWVRGKVAYALTMFLTAANSLRYHVRGGHHARFVDQVSNFTCGVIMGTFCAWDGMWAPLLMGALALGSYVIIGARECVRGHALMIHIPVLAGFWSIAKK
jgi:1-acyl-sn-glycerol-3-phosphate acyltransferase